MRDRPPRPQFGSRVTGFGEPVAGGTWLTNDSIAENLWGDPQPRQAASGVEDFSART